MSATSDDLTLTHAVQVLDDLNKTLALTSDPVAQAQLRAQIGYWQGVYQQAAGQAKAAETPGAFATALAGVGDSLGSFVGSQTGKLVTIVAIGLVVVWGLPHLIRALRE